MKKNILFVLAFIALTSSSACAQAFEKNNFVITGGFGASAGWFYKNHYAYQTSTNSYSVNVGLNVGYTFPFTAEFALHNRWGVGVSFSQNGYANSSSDKAKGNNYGVFGAFHLVEKEKLDLYTRLNFGLSTLRYNETYTYNYYDNYGNYIYEDNYVYNMSGGFVKPSFGLRVFFTKHVGIFADGGIGAYFLNASKYETSKGTYDLPGEKVRVTMVGAEVTAGVAFKL